MAGNQPGWNRPGFGSGNIGSGNTGQIGDNLGIVNRPNYGGNNFGGNSFQGGNTYNINNSYSSGYNSSPVINNVGGWGGGYGGWGGGGWAAPYYGNWYRGSFGNIGSFWGGFGVGALTSFGLSTLAGGWGYGYGGLGYGGYGYGGYPLGYSALYSMFPTWGMNTYSGWGLGPVATSWLYSDYTNPYYTMLAAAQPANTTVVYDYSQPINVTAAPVDSSVAESSEQIFSAARDAFNAGDYSRALDLADQVLKQTPNAAVVHEFRALVLFALKRYDEAAAVAYAVLSAGPGWNWSTLAGLYPDVETYTSQLRDLEEYVRQNKNSPSARFLLAYQYMVEGHDTDAAAQFENVTKIAPKDELAASFVKVLRKSAPVARATTAPAQAAAPTAETAGAAAQPAPTPPTGAQASASTGAPNGAPATDQPAEPPKLPPPPAALAGVWKAQPNGDLSIGLTLKEDGAFAWEIDTKGHKETIDGEAGFTDGTLVLQQPQGPPLVGKVTQEADKNKFVFTPPGASGKAGGLVFTR